ncbi:MAG: PIG-L deacetylase family protein [Gammaproteobacteria bacterium]
MLLSESLERALVVSPHADDEVLGCGGLLAKLSTRRCKAHVLYMAVDGFHHYGLDRRTSYQERVAEIESVTELLGCSYEIAYGDQDLIEKLDTLPKRELVDLFEAKINEHRPDLLILPFGVDYDQDHVATFQTAFAAARPIAQVFGKWLVPHVFMYEMTKIQWAAEQLPRPAAYCDISAHLGVKLEAVKRYATQFRSSPHIRSLESVTALASIRGKEIGVEYAEAFGVLRTVV